MLLAALAAVAVLCGVQAIRTQRLIIAAVWLAAVSACTAGMLYAVGAREVAVIELSVGVGLVTVLLVFAITMVGELTTPAQAVVPASLVWVLVIASVAILGRALLPLPGPTVGVTVPLAQALWQDRGLDVLAQAVLIFTGVLGVLGLLSGEARR